MLSLIEERSWRKVIISSVSFLIKFSKNGRTSARVKDPIQKGEFHQSYRDI
jgi:hypothetical protein